MAFAERPVNQCAKVGDPAAVPLVTRSAYAGATLFGAGGNRFCRPLESGQLLALLTGNQRPDGEKHIGARPPIVHSCSELVSHVYLLFAPSWRIVASVAFERAAVLDDDLADGRVSGDIEN
jgi:hypothetical protein